ncbi:MAG: IS1634 family transposase [Solirubrobacterales bacterium]|nr:IS1634 family transposase [Solirubrobacterales bacterium]
MRRGERSYTYVQLVEGYRDERGRVRHRVVANLGRKEELKASGQLEKLAGSFARLDPPLAGSRREVGALLLAWHFLRELDVAGIVDRSLPRSERSELSVGEVVVALVASRLCSPSPLYDIAGWASGAAVRELLGIPPQLLNDDRLGRALERFAVYAESVRGLLAAGAIERFGADAGRLHVDLSTVRVAGAYEHSALVAKGWGSDRHIARQVRTLQAATGDGVPLYLRPDPGNCSELALVGQSLERLAALARPGMLMVCDSALGQPKPLCQIHRAGLHFIVPLKTSTGFRERYLNELGPVALRPIRHVAERERRLPAAQRTRYRGVLADWQLEDPETGDHRRFRVAYIHSSEEQQQVVAARERALCKAEDELQRVKNGLGGRHYKNITQVQRRVGQIIGTNLQGLITVTVSRRANGRPMLTWQRDHAAIAQAQKTDGIYALATNLPGKLRAQRLLRLYKEQEVVERRHRDLKQTPKVRPIFLHNDDRIYALISIIGIALLIFGLLESELRKALQADDRHEDNRLPLLPEARLATPTGANILAAFQGLDLTYTHRGIELDPLTPTQQRILELLQIQPPWPQPGQLELTNCGKRG